MVKKYLNNIYNDAVKLNYKNIYSLLDKSKDHNLLDLGCDDGVLTKKLAKKIGTNKMYGVDVVDERIKLAKRNKIIVKKFDLNEQFDFEDNFFDVIHANQVIEHLFNTDNFLYEVNRVLKKDGYAIISTENASSWCNIFASIMGWQIFSLTNFSSRKASIGNPFSLHKDNNNEFISWNHVRVYNIRGLIEYVELFGFKVEQVKGAGYFPLPSNFGNIDTTHSHFITLKIRKR